MAEPTITIEPTHDQALVLFDWLARVDRLAAPELFVADAERRVVWDLAAVLERTLVEPLASDYTARVEQARAQIEKVG